MATKSEQKILDNLKNIENWRLLGLTEKEIAAMLEVGYSTFRALKKENSALFAVLNQAKDKKLANTKKQVAEVEKSLYKRSVGYDVTVTKWIKVKVPLLNEAGGYIYEGEKMVMVEELQEVKEKQHIPADVAAMRFYLMNKAAKEWKNDPERLELEKKRVANDTKRTQLAENNASGEKGGKTIEQILEEADQEAAGLAAVPAEEGAADA